MPPEKSEKLSLVDRIADSLVATAAIKSEAEALIDGYIEEGILVESARNDLLELFGKSIAKQDGKLVLTESYVTKDDVVRPAGQNLDFAFRENIAKRPHLGPPPPATDEEQEAFSDNAVTFLKARGDFLKKYGPAYAELRAVAWGLTGIGDFKSKGVRPLAKGEKPPEDKAAKIADARRHNPWSMDSGDAAQLRLAVINGKHFVKINGQQMTGPTAAAKAAALAGKTIAGGPLRQRVNNF